MKREQSNIQNNKVKLLYNDDSELIDKFVSTFEKLDDLTTYPELDSIAWELATGELDKHGSKQWKPKKVRTNIEHLNELYIKYSSILPVRLPSLYEKLLLSYRWAEVDLQICRLLPNPLTPGLDRLTEWMCKDSDLTRILVSNGCIQFGRASDLNYDPICFYFKKRSKRRDYPIFQIAHEKMLCNNRFEVIKEIAPSFRELILMIIDISEAK